ncbi:MAG: 50S ribosomal protein L23 [Candidatus Sungbacteria bacterium]|nr:50S ribosomal protein L23 [Candidatus Sungbacteria bacterium]
MGVLAAPRITEKAARLTGARQYVFRVNPDANKYQVRDAVAKRYGVRVERVRMVRIPGKTKHLGRRTHIVPGYTKAIVTLHEGESIDLE